MDIRTLYVDSTYFGSAENHENTRKTVKVYRRLVQLPYRYDTFTGVAVQCAAGAIENEDNLLI